MRFTVLIHDWPEPITVEPGETLLAAALAHGVPYPHGCQAGACGACKTRIVRGAVALQPFSDDALSSDEQARNLTLACCAVPTENLEVAWLEGDAPVHPRQRLACRVVEISAATHDITRLRLAVASGERFAFSAGQFARLTFPGLPPRDYSMANRPDEPVLEFHIRRIADGAVSSHVATRLAVGAEVMVEGPYGVSYLRPAHPGPIVAIGGGSGMAPITAIVRTALALGGRQDIHLYCGVRDERDVYDEALWRTLAARHAALTFTPVLSHARGPTGRRTGWVHEAVAADLPTLEAAKVYVAGPPPLVEAARAMAVDRGARRENIHADAFYTEAEKAESAVSVWDASRRSGIALSRIF